MPSNPPNSPPNPPSPRHSTPALGLQWLLFETAPHGMLIYDSAGAIIDANPAAERLLGAPLADIKGVGGLVPLGEVIREDGTPLPVGEQPAGVALRTSATVDDTVLGIRRLPADGMRWLSVSAIPLRLANSPQPYAAMCMFVDVTDQRAAVAALQASEERFRRAFEGSPVMMAISDLETGEFVDVNERYCEVTGYTRDQLVGHRSLDLGIVDADARAALYQAMKQHSRVRNYAMPIRTRSGETREVLMSGEVLTLASAPCLLTIANDITARTKMEEERDRMTSHLRHLRRLESVGRLASGMAHDLNNSLTAILALAELEQLEAKRGSATHENLQYIQEACLRGEATLRQLLEIARPQEASRDTVDLNALLRDEVTLLSRTTLQKVQILAEFDDTLPRVHGDGEALRHAMMTICLNAVDVMPAGGTLKVQTQRESAAFVVVAITDVRVPLTQQASLAMEAWSFAAMPREVSEAFGLAMVQEVIESQGGTMTVESAEGKAGRVIIRLPAVAPANAML